MRFPHDTFGGGRLYPLKKDRHVEPNLLNLACSKVYRAYVEACASLLIPGWAESLVEFGKVVSNGSSGIDAMVASARRYQEIVGSGRSSVLCSTGAHTSVGAAGKGQTLYVPLSSPHGQFDVRHFISEVREKKPALVILTVGRTDDGVIEMLPREISKTCLELRIPIGLDLSLGGLVSLLPDKSAFSGDNSSFIKTCWQDVVSDPSVRFIVTGFGKLIGSPGTECLFTLPGGDQTLWQAVQETFHVDCNVRNYIQSPNGFYNTTTQASGCVEETVETLRRIGGWGLRYLAVHAKQAAHDVGKHLRDGGIRGLPVTLNALTIPLGSFEEASRAQMLLWEKQRIAVAQTKTFPGIRAVFNLGVYYTKGYRERLAHAIGSSLQSGRQAWKGEPFDEPLYGPVDFRCTRDIIDRLKKLYQGEPGVATFKDRSSFKSHLAKAYEGLSLLRVEHDIPAYELRGALKCLGGENCDPNSVRKLLSVASEALAASRRKEDDLPRTLCLHMCQTLCDSLLRLFSLEPNSTGMRSKAVCECLKRFIDATGTLRERYLRDLSPLPSVA